MWTVEYDVELGWGVIPPPTMPNSLPAMYDTQEQAVSYAAYQNGTNANLALVGKDLSEED